jgi:hypothetical protein
LGRHYAVIELPENIGSMYMLKRIAPRLKHWHLNISP